MGYTGLWKGYRPGLWVWGTPFDLVGSLNIAKDGVGEGRTMKALECSLHSENLAALGTRTQMYL